MTNHCRASELRETDDTTKRIVVFFLYFGWCVGNHICGKTIATESRITYVQSNILHISTRISPDYSMDGSLEDTGPMTKLYELGVGL